MKRDPKRAGDEWDIDKIAAVDAELTKLPDYAALSGGWAWHYMSPPHRESKLFHDHKDVDVLVPPARAQEFAAFLKADGYARIWTKYDGAKPTKQVGYKEFYRVEKRVDHEGKSVKVQIDVFIQEVPTIPVYGHSVVEPKTLLSFYRVKQCTTDDCRAVIAARKIVASGQSPLNRKELVE